MKAIFHTANFYPIKTTGTRKCGVHAGKTCTTYRNIRRVSLWFIQPFFYTKDVVGKPCNIYRLQALQCREPHDNYRIYPQSVNITGFPHNRENLQRPCNALPTFAVYTQCWYSTMEVMLPWSGFLSYGDEQLSWPGWQLHMFWMIIGKIFVVPFLPWWVSRVSEMLVA